MNKHHGRRNDLTIPTLLQLLGESLETFHSVIGTSSVVEMHDHLRETLQRVSQIALSELILFDEDGVVTCGLLTPPGYTSVEAEIGNQTKTEFDRLEIKLFQQPVKQPDAKTKEFLMKVLRPFVAQLSSKEQLELPASEEDKLAFLLKETLKRPNESVESLLRQLAWEYKISFYWLAAIYGDFLVCRYKNDQLWQGELTPVYDVYRLRFDSKPEDEKYESLGEFPIALLIDVKKFGLESWAKELVIIGNEWPSLGALPRTAGFIIFSFGPTRMPEESLFAKAEELQLFSWLIFYAAFVFQTYALSQASAEEPIRLRDELVRNGWAKMLKKAADRYPESNGIEELIEGVMRSEGKFVVRKVLRDYSEYCQSQHPDVAQLLRKKLVRLLNPEEANSQTLLIGALEHLKVLFLTLSDEDASFSFLRQEVWPALIRLLSFSDATVRDLAMSAVEEVYRKADSGLQAEIGELLAGLVRNDINTGVLNERSLEPLLIAIRYGKNRDVQERLVKPICDSLLALPPDVELKTINRLFALLNPDLRGAILNFLPVEAHFDHDDVDQLRYIDNYLSNGEKLQSEKSGLLGSTELISVVSHKGGVGKTLVALGIASLLSERQKVCLVELDFFGPTLPYTQNLDGSRASKISLNEYLWAGNIGNLTENDRQKIFRGKRVWERHFDELARLEGKTLLENALWDAFPMDGQRLKILPCSLDSQLQDLMVPFVMTNEGLWYVKSQLEKLAIDLSRAGFDHVIFDTPAELKEIAMCTTGLSLWHRGKNVFVATLSTPSIEPLLESLPLLYSSNKNYLLINKVRELEREYAESKEALVDFLSVHQGRSNDKQRQRVVSEAVLDSLLEVQYCGCIPWLEKIEKIYTPSHPFTVGAHRVLVDSLRDALTPVIQ